MREVGIYVYSEAKKATNWSLASVRCLIGFRNDLDRHEVELSFGTSCL